MLTPREQQVEVWLEHYKLPAGLSKELRPEVGQTLQKLIELVAQLPVLSVGESFHFKYTINHEILMTLFRHQKENPELHAAVIRLEAERGRQIEAERAVEKQKASHVKANLNRYMGDGSFKPLW